MSAPSTALPLSPLQAAYLQPRVVYAPTQQQKPLAQNPAQHPVVIGHNTAQQQPIASQPTASTDAHNGFMLSLSELMKPVAPLSNLFTATFVRLGGFFNETGATLKEMAGKFGVGPALSSAFNFATWVVTFGYVAGHTGSTVMDAHNDALAQTQDKTTARAAGISQGLQTFAFQSMASLWGPILFIGGAQGLVENAFHASRAKNALLEGKSLQDVTKIVANDPKAFNTTKDGIQDVANALMKAKPTEKTNWLFQLGDAVKAKTPFLFGEHKAMNKRLIALGAEVVEEVSRHKVNYSEESLGLVRNTLRAFNGPVKNALRLTPDFQLASWKAVAGFTMIAACIKFFDPVCEAAKEHVFKPVLTNLTNRMLVAHGHAPYTPPEDHELIHGRKEVAGANTAAAQTMVQMPPGKTVIHDVPQNAFQRVLLPAPVTAQPVAMANNNPAQRQQRPVASYAFNG